MDEEQHLIAQLEAIQNEFIKTTAPIIKKLVALRSLKGPPPMIIDKNDLHKLMLDETK